MAKKNDNRMYLILSVFAVVMGLVTYWMYNDSKKAVKDAEIRREQEANVVTVKGGPVFAPGELKVTGVLKEILNNPLQGRGVMKPKVQVVDGNNPPTCVPTQGGVAPVQTKENFYHDVK